VKVLRWLLVLAPIAVIAHARDAAPLIVFSLSALAIIPLSALLGEATEKLATHTGPTLGGLLNATLGNLAELIIGALALRAGLLEVVKASITGSILGNLLLVLGAAQLAGGLRYKEQRFSSRVAGTNVGLLAIAVVGLVIPSLFLATHRADPAHAQVVVLSEYVAALLMLGYVLSLVFAIVTHPTKHREATKGAGGTHSHEDQGGEAPWSLRRSIVVLLLVGAALGYLSELLVGSIEGTVEAIGLSEIFVGLIVVPVIGNAAEHSSAVMIAMKNRMELSFSIAVGSSVQVALLIAPLLVFLGALFGQPMDLAFSAFEVASIALAVLVTAVLVADARSNWLEGALLLIVYGILAVAFFFY
jgi:Ca2+:H+ antiporter